MWLGTRMVVKMHISFLRDHSAAAPVLKLRPPALRSDRSRVPKPRISDSSPSQARRFYSAGRVHFWPFDGRDLTAGQSVVAEVYPALWCRAFPQDGRDGHQHDAYSIAAWMLQADSNGSLSTYSHPPLDAADREAAEIEGWILGVM